VAVLIVGCRTPFVEEPPLDADKDGWAATEDCEDNDPWVHPGQLEVCNGVDDDCDGVVDGEQAIGGDVFLADNDGDGWGAPATQIIACGQPVGYVRVDGDCDDEDPAVNPGVVESCNRLDDNCNGKIDDNAIDALIWFLDVDDDGAGDIEQLVLSCEQVLGIVANADDCDDTDPNAAAVAAWYADNDGDGYGDAMAMILACHPPSGHVTDNTDCDDTSDSRNRAAAEICNGLDDDCDGAIDENAIDAKPWFQDADNDGYGALPYILACQQPSGYAIDNSDCDDQAPDVHPGAEEWCDGTDSNCDGRIDNRAVDAAQWFHDGDEDGAGDPTTCLLACEPAPGWVADDGDCDDEEPTVSATSVWLLDFDDDGIGDPDIPFSSCYAPPLYVAEP
jgi:hypothetical protein